MIKGVAEDDNSNLLNDIALGMGLVDLLKNTSLMSLKQNKRTKFSNNRGNETYKGSSSNLLLHLHNNKLPLSREIHLLQEENMIYSEGLTLPKSPSLID